MNDKNGKTFSDLFLNSNNDEIEKVKENVNNLNEEAVTKKVDSFNSFSDLLNSNSIITTSDNDAVNSNEIQIDDKIVEKSVNKESNLFVSGEKKNMDLSIESKDNTFENKDEVLRDNDDIDKNIINIPKEEVIIDAPEKMIDDKFNMDMSIKKDSTNLFFDDKVDNFTTDNKELVVETNSVTNEEFSVDSHKKILDDSSSNLLEEKDEVNSLAKDMSNIFGITSVDTKIEDNSVLVENSSVKSSERNLKEKNIDKDKKSVEVKKNDYNSPFFENDQLQNKESSEVNPLFFNNISLEENSKTKKKVDKIDLSNTKNFNVKVVQKKEPLIKFFVGVISYAFFIWLLLIGITLLVYVLDIKIRASKGDYSAPTFNAYVVLTGSMLPEIQVNDVVVTKKVEAETLEVGDIITFASADSRFAGTIITHRIIKINPSKDKGGITFQTKGDNNNVADSTLVPEANIYGKVILKIPKLGYLQEFLATDGGWIIVILIPCLTVISYDIVKLFKGLKRKRYDNIKIKK